MINNTQPRPINVTPLIFTAAGLRLEPLEARSIPLSEMVGRKAQNGSIALEFTGEPLDLAAQIVIEHRGQSLSFNHVFSSRHVYFSSAFEGVFYLPSPSSQRRLAASNATGETRQLTLNFSGREGQQITRIVALGPHQTEVLALKDLVREPGQQGARVIGLSAAHDGRPGDVQLHGMVASPEGYSANARIVDAGVLKSNRLISPALVVGANASPTAAIFNGTSSEMNVSLIAHYSLGGQTFESVLDQVRLAAREARAIDLRAKVDSLPAGAHEIGLELQSYLGGGGVGAGGLIADLLLADGSGSQVFQVSPKDPVGEGSPGFSHPWQLDGDSNTILTIANPSQSDFAAYNVFLHFPGGNYTFDDSVHGYRLQPGEVRHIDLKRLRDEQVPSDLGVPLPAGVVSGQAKVVLQGERGDQRRLISEGILVNHADKTSVTSACSSCPPNPTSVTLSPSSMVGEIGGSQVLTTRCFFDDGSNSVITNPFAMTWFPGNSSIFHVTATWNLFKANFTDKGSTTLGANSSDCQWEFDFESQSCACIFLQTLSAAPANVKVIGPPHHLHVVGNFTGDVTCSSPNKPGLKIRQVRLEVVDGLHMPVNKTVTIQESFLNAPVTTTCGNGNPTPTGQVPTDSQGRFWDTFTVNCNTVGGSCGFVVQNRWSWVPPSGGSVAIGKLLNDVRHNGITTEGYTFPTWIPVGTEIMP